MVWYTHYIAKEKNDKMLLKLGHISRNFRMNIVKTGWCYVALLVFSVVIVAKYQHDRNNCSKSKATILKPKKEDITTTTTYVHVDVE